jgi:hypothetical protein
MINLKSEILNSKKVTSQRFKAFCIIWYGISFFRIYILGFGI